MALARCARCLHFGRYVPLLRATSVRSASGDVILPGPYPTTPEERAVAAKKYGMRVEDYEPYPDDGWGWGDYPVMPNQHSEDRDPHGDWDFPEERRNWGQVLHIEHDMYLRQRPNVHKENRKVPFGQQALIFGGIITTLATFALLGQKYKYFLPVAPKQYPFNDLHIEKGGSADSVTEVKHYAFPSSS